MEQGALLLTEGRYHTSDAKTAHGLVRGPSRWKILGLVDEHSAGAEAGTLLDGKDRGIPIFATLEEALQRLPQRPEWCVVGVATHGGRFPPSLRANLRAAARAGLGIVNGLHELAGDDPEITAHAPAIHDVRRPRPVRELAFWHGEAHKLAIPRVAVIGTDCALEFAGHEVIGRGVEHEAVASALHPARLAGVDHLGRDAAPSCSARAKPSRA